MKVYDIVALGELLIDFTQAGFSAAGMRLFEQNPGGAPANVLCLAAKQGLKTAFMGKVGLDGNGLFLKRVLEENGIATEGLILDPDQATTLAFVSIEQSGERHFTFCRKPGADTCLRESELNKAILGSCKIFHMGSLSLTDEPARSASFCALKIAKEAGAVISYDPNYRALLWPDQERAVDMMKKPLELADIVKMSDEEAVLLTGFHDPAQAAKAVLAMGPRAAVVTLGSEGAFYCTDKAQGYVPSFKVDQVADTTGAGDAFWGALLTKLAQTADLDAFLENIQESVRFANAAAALCVTKRGAIPAMPTADDIAVFMK